MSRRFSSTRSDERFRGMQDPKLVAVPNSSVWGDAAKADKVLDYVVGNNEVDVEQLELLARCGVSDAIGMLAVVEIVMYKRAEAAWASEEIA